MKDRLAHEWSAVAPLTEGQISEAEHIRREHGRALLYAIKTEPGIPTLTRVKLLNLAQQAILVGAIIADKVDTSKKVIRARPATEGKISKKEDKIARTRVAYEALVHVAPVWEQYTVNAIADELIRRSKSSRKSGGVKKIKKSALRGYLEEIRLQDRTVLKPKRQARI